jgi:nucleotide-binding universal stress UspA family protein
LIVHVADVECYPVGELVDRKPGPSPIELQQIKDVAPDDATVPFERRVICPVPTSDNVHTADEIVRLAERENVYAIVLGTHGRTGLMRLLAGSVAESVMRKASCPVITVRLPTTNRKILS